VTSQEPRPVYDRSKFAHIRSRSDRRGGGLVRPLIPPARPAGGKRTLSGAGGWLKTPRSHVHSLVLPCHWRAIPKDLPPKSLGPTITSVLWDL